MKRVLVVAALTAATITTATGCPCRGEGCVTPPSVKTITVTTPITIPTTQP